MCLHALIAQQQRVCALGVRRQGRRLKQNNTESVITLKACRVPRMARGKFLQYVLPQIVNLPLRNSAVCPAVSASYTRLFRNALTITAHWLGILLHISEVSGSNIDPQTGCHNFMCHLLVNYTKNENFSNNWHIRLYCWPRENVAVFPPPPPLVSILDFAT
jgi:hypothetical protein